MPDCVTQRIVNEIAGSLPGLFFRLTSSHTNQCFGHIRTYGESSIIYIPKQESRQLADWNKSVRVGRCLEVSHVQPQLSMILSERQHVK